MSHMPTQTVSDRLRRINIRDFGAVGDDDTDDTDALQGAADAHEAEGGLLNSVIDVPASPGAYMFSNWLLPAYSFVQGTHIAQSKLKRIPGSTGSAIREKTAAEGNTNGAISIWLRDLGVDGNSTTGNGIDLGYQVTDVNLETWASIENVHVQGFTSGVGLHLDANAISLKYIYAINNQDGIHVTGGYSQFHTVYGENNSRYQLRASGVAHSFFGVHCEMPTAGDDPAILIEGGAQSFYGVTIGCHTVKTNLITIASGANKTNLHRVYFFTLGAGAFTHGIYNTDWSGGRTGTVAYISDYEMAEDVTVGHWRVNMSDGKTDTEIGNARDYAGTLRQRGAAVFDSTVDISGGATIDAASGVVPLAVANANTAQTASPNNISSSITGTYNCTASLRQAIAVVGSSTATRSSGANDLENYGGVFSASGGQVNNALQTNSGNNLFNVTDSVSAFIRGIRHGSLTGPFASSGSGTPEGAVTAPVGSIFYRTDGSAGLATYIKNSGSGNTGWVPVGGVVAAGTITCVAKASMADTDYMTIGDGIQVAKLYEFDTAGDGVTAGRVQVNISASVTAADVAAVLKTAIEANNPAIAVTDAGSGVLNLAHKIAGTLGNVTITENVANAGFLVTGMTGGVNAAR